MFVEWDGVSFCFLATTATLTRIAASSPVSRRRLLLLTMSLALGLSVRNPVADLVALVLGKGDLRSSFCLIVFFIVFLVLGGSRSCHCSYLMFTSQQRISRIHRKIRSARISRSSLSVTI